MNYTLLRSKVKEEYLCTGIIVIAAVLVLPFFFQSGLPNLKLYRISLQELDKRDKELKSRKESIQQLQRLKQELSRTEEDYNNFLQQVILRPGSFEAVKVITDISAGLKIEILALTPLTMQRMDFTSYKDAGFLKFFQPEGSGLASDSQSRQPGGSGLASPSQSHQEEGRNFFLWEMPVLIKMKADYANLLKFIQRLEEARGFVKIKRIQIKKEAASPLTHSAELTISMFSLPAQGK